MTGTKKKKRVQKKEEIYARGLEYQINRGNKKKVNIAIVNYEEEYLKKIQTLQFIAILCIMAILAIFPLQFLIQGVQPNRSYYSASIGFITAGIVPSLIAIFKIIKGRKLALNISMFIFGIWILTLSWFFWEIILFISLLLIYYEITCKIIMISAIIDEDIQSIGAEGAYYHATIFLHRYLRFIAKFIGLLVGISLVAGIFGQYLLIRIQGDILFTIFVIVTLTLIAVLSRETITLDLQARLIQEEKRRREEMLERTHSKFS